MNNPDNSRQQILLTYSVLAGLTPLIPLPIVDDLFLGHFWRTMAHKLAVANNKSLSKMDAHVLSASPRSGCPLGCVFNLLLYPLKRILRKVFFFLEIKRAADTMSLTYYRGYLLDAALSHESSSTYGAEQVAKAIENVLSRTNTSLVSSAIYGLVRNSKGAAQQLGTLLVKNLPRAKRSPTEADVEAAAAELESGQGEVFSRLVAQLQKAISSLPAEHFYKLRQEMFSELSKPSAVGGAPGPGQPN